MFHFQDELKIAKESRKTAETVAKHLLARLQAEGGAQMVSTGPWQDAKTLYANRYRYLKSLRFKFIIFRFILTCK